MKTQTAPQVLLDEATIAKRVAELAAQIDAHYEGQEFLLMGILTGAYVFAADLSRRIKTPHDVTFIGAKSYGDATTPTAEVTLVGFDPDAVTGRDILIVEDLLDSGHTIHTLQHALAESNARSIRTCILVRKERLRPHEVDVDWEGFLLPDRWLVGYGIDCRGAWRHLPYIGWVQDN